MKKYPNPTVLRLEQSKPDRGNRQANTFNTEHNPKKNIISKYLEWVALEFWRNIKNSKVSWKKNKRHSAYPLLSFQADLIWWDGPFK
jgi:hypothetical protein